MRQYEPGTVYATQSGRALGLDQMPDDVFAEKILGDGICILPEDGRVYCPVDGIVHTIAESKHAIGIVTDDGAYIMVHIGVDTVELGGGGFSVLVTQGQRLSAGDPICTVDLGALIDAGYSIHTAVVLTNRDRFVVENIQTGRVLAGQAPVFTYRRR